MISFLDDTISNEIPPFNNGSSHYDPCTIRAPPSETPDELQQDLHLLVKRCQLHSHTQTCFKYDKNSCRFDLDESNMVPITTYDAETGTLTMRCLHGLVNNFTATILRAIRCNMDIKFIGTGASAKRVIYYITDYITKSQLKTHVAYAALEIAVKKLGDFQPSEDDITIRAKRLLQKCAYSLINNQELSAQQVASYLLDYEDHFTSHRYQNLYWRSFELFVLKLERICSDETPIAEGEHVDDHNNTHDAEGGDEVDVTTDGDGNLVISPSSTADYLLRGTPLESVNLWNFVSRVEKVKKSGDTRKHKKTDQSNNSDSDSDADAGSANDNENKNENEEDDTANLPEHITDECLWDCHYVLELPLGSTKRVRPRCDLLPEHSQSQTHRLKVRTHSKRKVPVLVGPALPRRD